MYYQHRCPAAFRNERFNLKVGQCALKVGRARSHLSSLQDLRSSLQIEPSGPTPCSHHIKPCSSAKKQKEAQPPIRAERGAIGAIRVTVNPGRVVFLSAQSFPASPCQHPVAIRYPCLFKSVHVKQRAMLLSVPRHKKGSLTSSANQRLHTCLALQGSIITQS